MRRFASFITTFLACLSAIVAVRLWDRFHWKVVFVASLCLVLANVLGLIKYWYEGHSGLDQWPHPHGRFYDEWLKLPEGVGDYYQWLANRMGNREPWLTWAGREKATTQTDDRP
jgi:hypothetical protein